jgi:hypothetical protein
LWSLPIVPPPQWLNLKTAFDTDQIGYEADNGGYILDK